LIAQRAETVALAASGEDEIIVLLQHVTSRSVAPIGSLGAY
jgi:hypothetical protein